MTIKRSLFVGDTDYTGVPLDDILEHFRDWKAGLETDLVMIENLRARIAQELSAPADRNAGVEFLNYIRDRFSRYVGDFTRLLDEVPYGVHERHVAILEQLCEDARRVDDGCVLFKQRNNLEGVDFAGDDPQALLADMYAALRDSVVDLFDLCNVIPRLRTFVGAPSSVRAPETSITGVLELKPNLFGLGLNLNYLFDKFLRRVRRSK